MLISFLVFLFALFLVLGAYLAATHGSDAETRNGCKSDLSEALLHSAHTEDIEVVLARNELMSEIPWLNRVSDSGSGSLAVETDVGPGGPAYHAVAFADVLGYGRNARGAGSVGGQSFRFCLMVGGGLVAASLPFAHVWWKRKKRFDQFLEHLPDALDLDEPRLSRRPCFLRSASYGFG